MYRWKSAVMTGQWRRSHQSALADALRAGQAEMIDSEIIPHDFVQIEQKDQQPAAPAIVFQRAA